MSLKIYESVLRDDGPMRVFLTHNKKFPKESASPYSVTVLNPRTSESFEIVIPTRTKKGTIGHSQRLEAAERKEEIPKGYRARKALSEDDKMKEGV